LTIERFDVVEALQKLIAQGLEKAYVLPGPAKNPFPGELEGMPSLEIVEENFRAYFYATRMGIGLQLSNDSWTTAKFSKAKIWQDGKQGWAGKATVAAQNIFLCSYQIHRRLRHETVSRSPGRRLERVPSGKLTYLLYR
jgi:hypothetical protein